MRFGATRDLHLVKIEATELRGHNAETVPNTGSSRFSEHGSWPFDIAIQQFVSLLEGFTSSRSSSRCLAITSVHSSSLHGTPSLLITMYIWKVNALIHDLRRGHVGRFDKVKCGAFLLIMASLCWLGINDPYLDSTVSAISILSAQLFSIYICHCTNTHGDNRDFWVRLCALGIPVGLRLACAIAFAIFFFSLPNHITRKVLGSASEFAPILADLPASLVLILGILVWGIRVSAHIDRVASSPLQSDHAGMVTALTASSR